MRRSAILLLPLLLLTSCGGSRGCIDKATTDEFGVCIGKGWERVTEETLRAENVSEETIAAFQLADARTDGRDNIVVSRERLPAKASPLAYAEANVRVVSATPEYSLIEKRDAEIDGGKTFLHIFTARPVPELPARRFYQISLTNGTTGYVFTGTLPFSVEKDIEEGLIDMLLSASLREK